MMSSSVAGLEVVGLGKSFSMPTGELTVLEGLDFRPRPGALTAVVGASGVGKSTLLHILGTLDRPTRGSVSFGGRDLFAMSSRDIARFRNSSTCF